MCFPQFWARILLFRSFRAASNTVRARQEIKQTSIWYKTFLYPLLPYVGFFLVLLKREGEQKKGSLLNVLCMGAGMSLLRSTRIVCSSLSTVPREVKLPFRGKKISTPFLGLMREWKKRWMSIVSKYSIHVTNPERTRTVLFLQSCKEYFNSNLLRTVFMISSGSQLTPSFRKTGVLSRAIVCD